MRRFYLIIGLLVVTLGVSLNVQHLYSQQYDKDGIETNSTSIVGTPFRGLSLSAITHQHQLLLGEDIMVTVTLSNVGHEKVWVDVKGVEREPYSFYRFALFNSDGTPVQKSKYYIAKENPTTDIIRVASRGATTLGPGESFSREFKVNEWFDIEKEGTYLFIAMRRLTDWGSGFAISNIAQIHIVKAADSDGEDAHPLHR